MMPINRILFIAPTDMQKTPGFYRAAGIASASAAHLHIVAFDYFGALTSLNLDHPADWEGRFKRLDKGRERHLAKRQGWLEELADELRQQGLRVTTEAVWAEQIATEVQKYVNALQPDVVIKDTHREPALLRTLIAPVDGYLRRECPVRLNLFSESCHPTPNRIVAAVDVQETTKVNDRIIAVALKLAEQCQAQLHLLSACDLSVTLASTLGYTFGMNPLPPHVVEEARQRQKAAFDQLAQRYAIPPQRQHFIFGPAAKVIANFASSQNMDVTVMAKQHYTDQHQLATGKERIGSTTEQVLARSAQLSHCGLNTSVSPITNNAQRITWRKSCFQRKFDRSNVNRTCPISDTGSSTCMLLASNTALNKALEPFTIRN